MGAIAGRGARDQLERHLDRLDGSRSDERLFVLTPDLGEPRLIADLTQAFDQAGRSP